MKVSGKFGVLVAMLIATGLSVAQAPTIAPQKHQGKDRVYDKDAGLSIVPPAGWEKAKATDGAFLNYKQPGTNRPANVIVQWMKNDGTTLEKLPGELKESYPKQFKEWKLLDESKPTIDGKKAYVIACRYSLPTKDEKFDLAAVQYWIYGNNQRIYLLTFTTHEKEFAKTRKMFDASAMSVQTD